MSKVEKVKPAFYAACYEHLKNIARSHGYNLLIHGSFNRDMDLVAVPWHDNPSAHKVVLLEMARYLGTPELDAAQHYMFSTLPGGRSSYVLNISRIDPEDPTNDRQYYIDISFTPLADGGFKGWEVTLEMKADLLKVTDKYLEGYDVMSLQVDTVNKMGLVLGEAIFKAKEIKRTRRS